jgi:hypothetical protein
MIKNELRNDGAVLRYIAVVAMFIDHLALCMYGFIPPGLYMAGRIVGRISYPIFAYCLAAGFRYTRDIRRYAGRIAIAAVISEIPFDLMVGKRIWYPEAQNVMWTLLIGLLMLWGVDRVRPRKAASQEQEAASVYADHLRWLLTGLGKLLVIAMACGLATLLHTDYEWEGILVIAAFSLMPAGMFDIPRGSYPRYLFYAFYPVHMLALVLLRHAMRS